MYAATVAARAPLTEAEITRRQPVWQALSDLFLDTEVRWWVPRAAKVLVDSGYPVPVLEAIWRREVTPEFGANLLSVAGEWAGFDIDVTSLARRAGRSGRPASLWDRMGRWRWRHVERLNEPLWQAVLQLRSHLMDHDEQSAEMHTRLWADFAHVWTEPSLSAVLMPEGLLASVRDSGLSRAQCLATLEQVFLHAYGPLTEPNQRAWDQRGKLEAFIDRAFAEPASLT